MGTCSWWIKSRAPHQQGSHGEQTRQLPCGKGAPPDTAESADARMAMGTMRESTERVVFLRERRTSHRNSAKRASIRFCRPVLLDIEIRLKNPIGACHWGLPDSLRESPYRSRDIRWTVAPLVGSVGGVAAIGVAVACRSGRDCLNGTTGSTCSTCWKHPASSFAQVRRTDTNSLAQGCHEPLLVTLLLTDERLRIGTYGPSQTVAHLTKYTSSTQISVFRGGPSVGPMLR